jgi:hypothetical protein
VFVIQCDERDAWWLAGKEFTTDVLLSRNHSVAVLGGGIKMGGW